MLIIMVSTCSTKSQHKFNGMAAGCCTSYQDQMMKSSYSYIVSINLFIYFDMCIPGHTLQVLHGNIVENSLHIHRVIQSVRQCGVIAWNSILFTL